MKQGFLQNYVETVWRRVSNNSPPWPGSSSYLDIRKEVGGVDSSAQGAQPFFAPDMRGPQLGDVRLSCCTTHLCTCTMCTLPFIKFHRAPPLHRTALAHAHSHRLPRPGSRDMSPIDSSVRSSCAFWKTPVLPWCAWTLHRVGTISPHPCPLRHASARASNALPSDTAHRAH